MLTAIILVCSLAVTPDLGECSRDNAVHVCNAPSPAATSSLQIGHKVADELSSAID